MLLLSLIPPQTMKILELTEADLEELIKIFQASDRNTKRADKLFSLIEDLYLEEE
jgi:hypothetical protein